MNHDQVLMEVERGGVVAILRGDLQGRTLQIAETLIESGVTALEVTMNSPGVVESIRMLAREIGDRCAVGAGTVLEPSEVGQVADAGARFIVSPNIDGSVIEMTKKLGLASFPGGATCTEMISGMRYGADAIKIFPASAFSPSDVRTVRGPLPDIRLIPTGGMTPEACTQYIVAGAWAVGIGSALVDAKSGKTLDQLRDDATRFVESVKQGRQTR